ncbi:RNA polymerase sigma factor [Bacillus sp. FJAT-49732]|uniref:RNA polymerase sigma factor n=1 Tax=Lederbergia citrisecunda TaxID=2833583 RepID=A0A942TNZ6_9BACI|nr:RNA polymerase sigma factor [Lederbergia citrisecunda]MBS4200863.1 RNA polymerase sigma factor [Lederbergia citrisecunda]
MSELERLYEEIQPKIYAFFFIKTSDKSAAEDLTHDVFYEAIKGIHSFSGKSSLQTWIFSIAKNVLRKYYRSKKYATGLHEKLTLDVPELPSSPEDVYMMKEGHVNLVHKISSLDEVQKEIITLRLYGELSFKEIGELINKSENYVRVTFHRAKLRLQKEMGLNHE